MMLLEVSGSTIVNGGSFLRVISWIVYRILAMRWIQPTLTTFGKGDLPRPLPPVHLSLGMIRISWTERTAVRLVFLLVGVCTASPSRAF